jgi:WD40 repeat protein
LKDYEHLKEHNNFSNLLLLPDKSLIVCSVESDNDIYCYYILLFDYHNDFKYSGVFFKHYYSITCVVNIPNKRIASSSKEKIYIWDTVKSLGLKELEHGTWKISVTALIFKEKYNILLSADVDTIKVWIMNDYHLTKIIVTAGITCLILLPNDFFASGSRNGKIHIWNMDSYQCINTLGCEDESMMEFLLLLRGNKLLSVSWDGKLIILN